MNKHFSPKVSIIIPTHGRPSTIIQCIESVLKQTYQNIETVVVDDNGKGTDNQKITEDLLTPYVTNKKIVYLIREKNGGGAAARNDGIKASQGELISFLDDDDEYLPPKIERQVDALLNSDSDIVVCNAIYIDNSGRIERYKGNAYGETLESFIMAGRALTPMILAKKEVIQKINGFEASPRFQDHIFMLKMLASGAKSTIINDRLYRCHRHDGIRISRSPKSLEGYQNKHKYENMYSHVLTERKKQELDFNQKLEMLEFSTGISKIKNSIALYKHPKCNYLNLTKKIVKFIIGRNKV